MDKNKPKVKKTELELIQEEDEKLTDELVLIRSKKRLEAFRKDVQAEKDKPYEPNIPKTNTTKVKSFQYTHKAITLLIEDKQVWEIKEAVNELRTLNPIFG